MDNSTNVYREMIMEMLTEGKKAKVGKMGMMKPAMIKKAKVAKVTKKVKKGFKKLKEAVEGEDTKACSTINELIEMYPDAKDAQIVIVEQETAEEIKTYTIGNCEYDADSNTLKLFIDEEEGQTEGEAEEQETEEAGEEAGETEETEEKVD